MYIEICPICEKISDVEIIRREETHSIRNEEITAEIEISRCFECNQEFETAEQMENNLEAFRRIYRQRYRIMSQEEIVQLRKKYGISQKALGKVLDIGELTINTYEQGALPSGAHNQLLQLISEPLIFKKVYDKNKKKLSPRQINKIEEHLNNILNTTTYDPHLFDQYDLAAEKAPVYGVSNHCGDILKLYAMVQLILYESAKPLYKMAVLKLLFYSDFAHYKEHKKASELGRITHAEELWLKTENGKEISYDWAESLKTIP